MVVNLPLQNEIIINTAEAGTQVKVQIASKDIADFSDTIFTLKYDASILFLSQLNFKKVDAPLGDEYSILPNRQGELAFKPLQECANAYWSGLNALIEFTAVAKATTTISITHNNLK